MTAPIGHNQPTIDLPEGFEVDYGHILMDRVFYHPDLKDMIGGDRLLLAAMGFGMKRGCAKIRMSLRYANALMGENIRTTRDRFERLRKLGWLCCVPGKGTRPTEWELDLPPSELEVAVRKALEAYNEQLNSSVGVTTHTMRSSVGAETHSRRATVNAEPHTGDMAFSSVGAEAHTSRTPKNASVCDRGPQCASPDPLTKELTRQAGRQAVLSPSEGGGEVSDEALRQQREEMFGPGTMPSAERLARFLNINVADALDLMEAHAGAVSPGVVLNAIGKLKFNGLDQKGKPIKDRIAWFEKGIGFARADAGGKWLEAPKQTTAPDLPMRDGYPVNSEGKNIFELFGYDTLTEGAG